MTICHGSYFEFASSNVPGIYSNDYNDNNIIYYFIAYIYIYRRPGEKKKSKRRNIRNSAEKNSEKYCAPIIMIITITTIIMYAITIVSHYIGGGGDLTRCSSHAIIWAPYIVYDVHIIHADIRPRLQYYSLRTPGESESTTPMI